MHYVHSVDDETDFWSSSKHSIHCVRPKSSILALLETLATDDYLWFMNYQTGLLIAVATYVKYVKREVGPVLALTMSNEELGLSPSNKSEYEIHYHTLCDIRSCELTTEKKEKHSLWQDESNELATIYENLKRYSKASFKGPKFPTVEPMAVRTFNADGCSASSSTTGAEEIVYRKKEHCRSITGDTKDFKQSHVHFESDIEAEMHARENGYRYFMRCKLTEGGTYWFLQDKVRRMESRVVTDPAENNYRFVSWERC